MHHLQNRNCKGNKSNDLYSIVASQKTKRHFLYKSRKTDGLNIAKLTAIVMKIIVQTMDLQKKKVKSEM